MRSASGPKADVPSRPPMSASLIGRLGSSAFRLPSRSRNGEKRDEDYYCNYFCAGMSLLLMIAAGTNGAMAQSTEEHANQRLQGRFLRRRDDREKHQSSAGLHDLGASIRARW